MAAQEEQRHPANTVFLLLEDRQFRFNVVRPGLEKEKQRLGRLVTGKHQVRGFRNISKAPLSMLLPVIADEASVAPELAQALLTHWMEANPELKEKVGAKLKETGYEPAEKPFDEFGNIGWKPMAAGPANQQFEGEFLPDEEENSVMLMSLLLGWFGSDEEEEQTEQETPKEEKPAPKAKAKPKKAADESKEDKAPAKQPAAKKAPAKKAAVKAAEKKGTTAASKAKKSTAAKKTAPKSSTKKK